MGAACIRGAGNALDMHRQAVGMRIGGDVLIELSRTLDRAELQRAVFAPIHAGSRQGRIELERAPADVEGDAAAELFECAFEPVLTDIAPGADDVGDDVEAGARRGGGR